MARTFVLIAPAHPVLHRVSCSYETIPKCNQTLFNTPKHEFRVQWGGLGDFVAPAFALIALVHPVLHRLLCGYETIPNAPKHYATHQNMSLGSNGVDWVVHCEKSGRGFVARTFAIIAPVHTVLHR